MPLLLERASSILRAIGLGASKWKLPTASNLPEYTYGFFNHEIPPSSPQTKSEVLKFRRKSKSAKSTSNMGALQRIKNRAFLRVVSEVASQRENGCVYSANDNKGSRNVDDHIPGKKYIELVILPRSWEKT